MLERPNVLVVEDERNYQSFYQKLLQPHFNIDISSSEKSRNLLENNVFAAVMANCYLYEKNKSRTDGFSLLRFARSQGCITPFVFVAETRNKYINWQSDTYGAFDLIQKRKPDFHSHLINSLKIAADFFVFQSHRNKLEQEVLDIFNQIPNITPICWDYTDQALFETFFEKDNKLNRFCYANNWLYICQAARRNGSKYFDGKVLITIEAYKNDNDYQFEVIRPLGQNAAKKAYELAQHIKPFTKHPVILKRLEPDQFYSLLNRGCEIHKTPESNELEDFFDDIYPQVVIDLNSFLYNLNLPEMAWFRRGLRQFTRRNYTIKDLKPHLYKDVREVIFRWKRSFITRYKNKKEFYEIPEQDSYYLDPYLPFVEYFGRTNENNNTIATIFYVYEKPVGFSLLVRVSDTCMAMYANVGDTDYTGLSNFMLYQNFLRALWSGYSFVNLGGTESESLFNFYLRLAGGMSNIKNKNRQSLTISWEDLNLQDINKEFTRFKKVISQKNKGRLKENLNNLDVATFLENIASKQDDLKILRNLTAKNRILERKYLIYNG